MINALNAEEYEKSAVWGIAGESFAFNFDDNKPSDSDLHALVSFADQNDLINQFQLIPRMPSSCFASSRKKWDTRGNIRRGP